MCAGTVQKLYDDGPIPTTRLLVNTPIAQITLQMRPLQKSSLHPVAIPVLVLTVSCMMRNFSLVLGNSSAARHTREVPLTSPLMISNSGSLQHTITRRWLHKLGFHRSSHHKGVYFDGHKRDDVVQYRQQFLHELDLLDKKSPTFDSSDIEVEDGEKPLIRVCHDESTFYANADQGQVWTDGEMQVLKQKSLGASIMVSDFIDEKSGFLCHDGEEARLLLETNKDGYFNNEGFIVQVQKALDIFERKYPDARALMLFDNAPSHKKCSEDERRSRRQTTGYERYGMEWTSSGNGAP